MWQKKKTHQTQTYLHQSICPAVHSTTNHYNLTIGLKYRFDRPLTPLVVGPKHIETIHTIKRNQVHVLRREASRSSCLSIKTILLYIIRAAGAAALVPGISDFHCRGFWSLQVRTFVRSHIANLVTPDEKMVTPRVCCPRLISPYSSITCTTAINDDRCGIRWGLPWGIVLGSRSWILDFLEENPSIIRSEYSI